MAAGKQHTVLLKSDGTAVAWGCNKYFQCDIPSLPEKVKYIQVAAGAYHTVFLRDDNRVVACGYNRDGRCEIPSYNDYIQVAAGTSHTVLLREDGTVVACGDNEHGECVVPALENKQTYKQIAAGCDITVLIRSDGGAIAFGRNNEQQCNIPTLKGGLKYIQAAAGSNHTVLLRSDGTVVFCGKHRINNKSPHEGYLQCWPASFAYTRVAAGGRRTVLLRSDGECVVFDNVVQGRMMYPNRDYEEWPYEYLNRAPLCEQLSPATDGSSKFTEVATGGQHTILLTSAGKAWAYGSNSLLQCNFPLLSGDIKYVPNLIPELVLTASWDTTSMHFTTMGSTLVTSIFVTPDTSFLDVYCQLMREIGGMHCRVKVVLPNDKELSLLVSEKPLGCVGELESVRV